MTDSILAGLTAAPPDPILGVAEKFRADPRSQKVNLGVGAYLTEEGFTPLLESVKIAERDIIAAGQAHTYLPIDGLPGYGELVRRMVFGPDSELAGPGRAVTVQSLGGTGALKVGLDFLFHLCSCRVASTSLPTWGNHNALLKIAGYEVRHYRYYDRAADAVDFAGMMEDLGALPAGAVAVLHACCHNPSGYDLSHEQWDEVIALCRRNRLVPLLDMAYQGFGSGLDEDAWAVRRFAESGLCFLAATSYSKSFNLYGERIGALTLVADSQQQAEIARSQLKAVIRAIYSNPPGLGAKIVARVLSDPELTALWQSELTGMRERIRGMREALAREMAALGAKRDFSFVTRQAGMFSFTGLSPEQIDRLATEFGVYAVRNGRICICGLNRANVGYVARAICAVL